MTATTAPTLDRQEFTAAIQTLPPDAVAGDASACGDCPLARWLRQATGQDWLVTLTTCFLAVEEPADFRPLPEWAVAFVAVLRQRHGWGAVTAGQALRVLTEVAL